MDDIHDDSEGSRSNATSSSGDPSMMDGEILQTAHSGSDASGDLAVALEVDDAEEEEDKLEHVPEEDFPMDDFVQVSVGLKNSSWTVYPSQLANCLAAAVRIASAGDFPNGCSKELRTLYRELVPSSFEKCVESTDCLRWNNDIQAHILDACAKLAELVAVKLTQTETTEEAEDDMMHMLTSMCLALDQEAPYHKKHILDKLPRKVVDMGGLDEGAMYAANLFTTVPRALNGVGTLRDDEGDGYDDDDDSVGVVILDGDDDEANPNATPVRHGGRSKNARRAAAAAIAVEEVEGFRWLRYLINHFGLTGGFDAVLDILNDPSRVSLKLLDAVVKPMAKCAPALSETLLLRFEENTQITLEYLAGVVERGDAALTGGGNSSARNLNLTSTLRSLQSVLGQCVGAAEAEKRVSPVNHAVVEGMLVIPHFSIQLAAVREINVMLERASSSRLLGDEPSAAAMHAAVAWLEDKRVLPHVLKTDYLHHKQYVDQVATVLRFLLRENAMREEHLELLWAITQSSYTFEEVKNNVLDLLATLAWHFSGEQLDSLFSRLERAGGQGTSLADSRKILEMVQKLAKSDGQGVMAERLLELLWRMVHAGEGAGSAVEMVAAFTQILGHYHRMGRAAKETWVARALRNAKEGSADLAISLHLMQSIVMLDSERATAAAAVGGGVEGAGAGVAGTPSSSGGGGAGEEEDNKPAVGGKGKGMKKRRRGESNAAAAARENAAARREWLSSLDYSDGLVTLLVSSLERFQAAAWADGATLLRPIVGAVTGYYDTLKALVKVILFVLKEGEITVELEMAQRLWAAFEKAPRDAVSLEADRGKIPVRYRDLGLLCIFKLLNSPPCSVSEQTVLDLLRVRLVSEPAGEMTTRGWNLFREFFLQAGLDSDKLAATSLESGASGEGEQQQQQLGDGEQQRVPPSRPLAADLKDRRLVVCSADMTGMEQLWRVALDANGGFVSEAVELLIQLHTNLDGQVAEGRHSRGVEGGGGGEDEDEDEGGVGPGGGDETEARLTALHREFLALLLQRLSEAAAALDEGDAVAAALAEQRAERCMIITQHFIVQCEGTTAVPGTPLPHGGSFPGFPVSLEIIPSQQSLKLPRFHLKSHSNVLVHVVRESVARELDTHPGRVRLLCGGRELLQDHCLLRDVVRDVVDGTALQAMISPADLAATRSDGGGSDGGGTIGKEKVPPAAAALPRSLLAHQPEAYDVLFRLAESSSSGARGGAGVGSGRGVEGGGERGSVRQRNAQDLLLMLPTQHEVRAELCALLVEESVVAAVSAGGGGHAGGDATGSARGRARLRSLLSQSPARLVYTLQTLDGLLSPGFGLNRGDDDTPLRLLRTSFAALGCTRDILAVLPQSSSDGGGEGEVGSRGEGENVDVGLAAVAASGAAAWRDPALRRALCASALNLLKILLAPPSFATNLDVDTDAEGVSTATAATETSLGSLGGAIGGMGICTPSSSSNGPARLRIGDDDMAGNTPPPESADAAAAAEAAAAEAAAAAVTVVARTYAALAREAVPKLTRLAYAMGTGRRDEWDTAIVAAAEDAAPTAMDQDGDNADASAPGASAVAAATSGADGLDLVTRDDMYLALDAAGLLVTCLQRAVQPGETGGAPTRHPAELLLEQPLFPAMLRDMVIRSPLQFLRAKTIFALLRLIEGGPPLGEAAATHSNPPASVPAGIMHALLEARAVADLHPTQCREFFTLLCHVLKGGSGGVCEVSDAVAEELLAREVEALRVAPPATEEDSAHLESRLALIKCLVERLERSSVGCRAAGLGLVKVLMFRCLFPEAVPVLRPPAEVLRLAGMPAPVVRGEDAGAGDGNGYTHAGGGGRRRHSGGFGGGGGNVAEEEKSSEEDGESEDDDVTIVAGDGDATAQGGGSLGAGGGSGICGVHPDVEMLEEHLKAVCSTPATRQAAFELLADLASHDTDNMLEVTETLLSLHYRGGVDIHEWDQLPSGTPRATGGYVGLKNAGATCYMNSVFQQLYMQPGLRSAVLSVTCTAETEEERRDSVFYQFQTVFASLAGSHMDHYTPRGFWRAFKDYDGEPINLREHQDCFEFFTRLQDMVDAEFKRAVTATADADAAAAAAGAAAEDAVDAETPAVAAPVRGAMEAVMGGQLVNQMLCRKCPEHRSAREEPFFTIPVDVRNKQNLAESLASYVSGELMEAENQYMCEQCGCKVDAVKRQCIQSLPHTLCIQLKRFEFDYESMQRLKYKGRFEFPLELDMTPFTVEGLERAEAAAERSGSPNGGGGGGRGSGGAPEVDLPDLDNAPEHYQYRLVGVVVHSGSAFAGHYYSYIRERGAPPGAPLVTTTNSGGVGGGGDAAVGERWHVYDDQRVDPYDISSLEADTFGGKYTVNLSGVGGGSIHDDDGEGGSNGGGSKARITEHDRPNSAYMLFYERVEGIDVVVPPSRSSTPAIWATEEMAAVPTPRNGGGAGSPAAVPLPAMPRQVRSEVMTQNLQFVFNGNLFSREYFDFIRQLVDSTLRGIARKAPRRSRAGPSGGGGASRGPGSGRLSCGDGPGPSGDSPAPAPGRRRSPEDEDEHAVLGIRIATEFLCHVYLRAHHSLRERDTLAAWRCAVAALLDQSAAACRWFLEFLRDHPEYPAAFLMRCPSQDARETFASIVSSALRYAVTHDDGGASAAEGLAQYHGNPGGGGFFEPGQYYPAPAPLPATVASISERRQTPRTARLVDKVLRNLVSLLNDAIVSPSKLCSPTLYFYVLHEYASLGPAQRLQLFQYDVLRQLAVVTSRSYHAPTPRAIPSSLEMLPAYQLLAALLCSCDLTGLRLHLTQRWVQRALEMVPPQHQPWLVGDLTEDSGAGVPISGGMSPVAVEGGFSLEGRWAVMLVEPSFLIMITDLAGESDSAMDVLLHMCWRWEYVSRYVLAEIVETLETQDFADVVPFIAVAEKILLLFDWCSILRASALLEGRKGMAPTLHISVLLSSNQRMDRMGLIELASLHEIGYQKRYLILRFVIKAALSDALPHLQQIIHAQYNDFMRALDLLEDDIHRFGSAPLMGAIPGGAGSDTTPTSARHHPNDQPEWILEQGRDLCQ